MSKKKGVLIDALDKQEFRSVEYESLQDIYDLLKCEMIEAVPLSVDRRMQMTVFVDEEGLLKEGRKGFFICGYPQMLIGNGLITVVDEQGENRDLEIDLRIVEGFFKFIEVSDTEGS